MSTLYKNQMDTGKPDFNRRIFCIEYPGRVNNVNNMLDTLGGIKSISTAYSSKNRRVELRFRPNDIYCKPACGDRHSTVGLLIKVKVKKKLRDPNMPCSSKDSEKLHSMTFTTSLVGVVDSVYKFENLCEYQYLPMDRINPDNPDDMNLENIHDRLFPSEIPEASWIHKNEAPYFLPPAVFSRFDTIHFYSGNKVSSIVEKKDKNIAKRREVPHTHTIGRTRKRRQNYGVFVKFSEHHVPTSPNPEALRLLKVKFITEEQRNILIELFEERPIWTKNHLLYRTTFNSEQLKHILPTVAYYFTTGPWRVMWCKYGYDPTADPKNLLYQVFDFRMKNQGFQNKIKSKRSYTTYLLPYKSSPSSRPKVVIMNRHSIARALHEAKNSDKKNRPAESTCIFRPGVIPTSRQIFYQYCDVKVPEIQKIIEDHLATLPTDTHCDKTTGFLPPGFDTKCREIVNALIHDELRKSREKPGCSREPDIIIEENEDVQDESMEEYDDDVEEIPEEIMDSDVDDEMVVN